MSKADWTHRSEYILYRHGILPSWADEALADDDAVEINPDPASTSGRSIRYGVNAWRANDRDRRRYLEDD
jgi:hypothetical protein